MAFLKEVGFGVDKFNKPLTLSAKDSLAQILYNIFVMEPGTYPSQPDKGIGIRRYLYKYRDEINIGELKEKIFINCTGLLSFLDFDGIDILIPEYEGNGLLIVIIPVKGIDEQIFLAFSADENNNILFKFQTEAVRITGMQ